MREEWRPIKGFVGFYEISSLGRVRRSKTGRSTFIGRILKPAVGTHGYQVVKLSRYAKTTTALIHALVIESFIGELHGYDTQSNHKNGIKTDNRAVNLERCTAKENSKHIYASGLRKTRPIICLETQRVFQTIEAAAREYGVWQSNISHVVNGRLKRTGGLRFAFIGDKQWEI